MAVLCWPFCHRVGLRPIHQHTCAGHPSDPSVRNSGYKSSATARAQQCSTEFVLNTQKSERSASSGSSRDYRNINTSRGTPDILNNSPLSSSSSSPPITQFQMPEWNQSGAIPAPGQNADISSSNQSTTDQPDRLINPINQSKCILVASGV